MSATLDILIVEDDEYIRDSIAELLESEGYLVAVAVNGQDALEKLRILPKPSLILLDLMMPIKDGFAFRKEQELDLNICDIPVVIMSADGHVQEKQMRIGAKKYIKKPADIDVLLNTVKEFAGIKN